MNNPIRTIVRAAALMLAAAGLLAGCSGPAERPPLEGTTIGGPFALTDQDGKAVTDKDFAGKYRLIYFGYTFCPDVCPVDVQNIMRGYKLIRERDPALAAELQPIFVTVDPARDTPAALKQYTDAFPGLIALTGSEADIARVAKAFAVFYKKVPDKSMGYKMDHSRQAMLFGPQGQPLALVAQDKDGEAVAADILRWAK